jgi:hypothetical protein
MIKNIGFGSYLFLPPCGWAMTGKSITVPGSVFLFKKMDNRNIYFIEFLEKLNKTSCTMILAQDIVRAQLMASADELSILLPPAFSSS